MSSCGGIAGFASPSGPITCTLTGVTSATGAVCTVTVTSIGGASGTPSGVLLLVLLLCWYSYY